MKCCVVLRVSSYFKCTFFASVVLKSICQYVHSKYVLPNLLPHGKGTAGDNSTQFGHFIVPAP